MSEFAAIIREAKRDISRRRELSQYQVRFGEGFTDVANLLYRHPTMSTLIGKSGCTEIEFGLCGLHSLVQFPGSEQFVRSLIERVLHFSVIFGEIEGAKRLDEALRVGAERGLSGYEVTFFSGLHLDEPWDVVPGLSLMPYEIYRQQLDELGRYGYDSCLGRALWRDEAGASPSVSALIRRFKWGPAFSRGKPAFTKEYEYEYGDEFLESGSLIDLLSTITELPLQIIAHHSRAEQWFYDLVGDGFDIGCHYFRRSPVDSDPGRGKEIAAGVRREFMEAVELWAKFADQDRRRAQLVASRLSGAMSRKGSLALEDRVLDVAIALEILYAMTRKDQLASWAAVLLEDDKRKQDQVCLKVEALHECRTAIVHDLSEAGRGEATADVYSEGFEIARRSLIIHLNRGAFLSRIDRKLLERGIRPPTDV